MTSTGNTILVTDGTSGIGCGLPSGLPKVGNKVFIKGRRKALLDKIVSEHPGIQ